MRKLYIGFILAGFCLLGLSLQPPTKEVALQPVKNKSVIDLDVIAQIESSQKAGAYNARSGATGMYQITEIALKDYNQQTGEAYTLRDMYDPVLARKVADWTFHVRYPQFFKKMQVEDSLENRIIAWNAGISHVRYKKDLPAETRNYISKYQRLTASK